AQPFLVVIDELLDRFAVGDVLVGLSGLLIVLKGCLKLIDNRWALPYNMKFQTGSPSRCGSVFLGLLRRFPGSHSMLVHRYGETVMLDTRNIPPKQRSKLLIGVASGLRFLFAQSGEFKINDVRRQISDSATMVSTARKARFMIKSAVARGEAFERLWSGRHQREGVGSADEKVLYKKLVAAMQQVTEAELSAAVEDMCDGDMMQEHFLPTFYERLRRRKKVELVDEEDDEENFNVITRPTQDSAHRFFRKKKEDDWEEPEMPFEKLEVEEPKQKLEEMERKLWTLMHEEGVSGLETEAQELSEYGQKLLYQFRQVQALLSVMQQMSEFEPIGETDALRRGSTMNFSQQLIVDMNAIKDGGGSPVREMVTELRSLPRPEAKDELQMPQDLNVARQHSWSESSSSVLSGINSNPLGSASAGGWRRSFESEAALMADATQQDSPRRGSADSIPGRTPFLPARLALDWSAKQQPAASLVPALDRQLSPEGWSFVLTANPDSRYSGVAMVISHRIARPHQITFCSWLPGLTATPAGARLSPSQHVETGRKEAADLVARTAAPSEANLAPWPLGAGLHCVQPAVLNADGALMPLNQEVSLPLPPYLKRWALAKSLQHAGIDDSMISLIVAIHEGCTYSVQHATYAGNFPLQVGVRQGCALAPLLFCIFSCWISDMLDTKLGVDWCARHHTAFADDNLVQWVIQSESDLHQMCVQIQVLFDLLHEVGMSVNVLKSGLLIKLRGPAAKRWLRGHVRRTAEGEVISVGTPGRPVELPRQTDLTYLGIKLSYGNFELQSCLHRLRAARLVRQRLVKLLHSSGLRLKLRLQLYSACVRSSLLYALHAVGLTPSAQQRLSAADARFVRAIARNPVHLTRTSNLELYRKLKLRDVPALLAKLLAGRARKSTDPEATAAFQAHLCVVRAWQQQTWQCHQHGLRPAEAQPAENMSTPLVAEVKGVLTPLVEAPAFRRALRQGWSLMSFPEAEIPPTSAAQEMLDVLGMAKQQNDGNAAPAARREPTESMEQDAWRKAKFARPDQKGSGGKGYSPWANWRPSTDTWQDDEKDDQATTGVDRATQQLLSVLVKLAIRHEEELSKIRIDTTLICYLDTGASGIVPQVRKVAEAWATQYEAGTVRTPLKVILLLSIFEEAGQRITSILQEEEKLAKAKEWQWLQEGSTALDPCWTYFQWNPRSRRQEPSPLPPIKNSDIRHKLDYLAKSLAEDGVLTKFKATRRMSNTDRYASAVLPFFCSLSLRGDTAAKSHEAIKAMVNCSALKPIGMRIKPARGERQPLASELEKAYLAVPYTDWQERQPWTKPSAKQVPENTKALCWVALLTDDAASCGGKARSAIMLAQRAHKPYLPDCIAWHQVLRGWAQLKQQHDAGMFLAHVLHYAAPVALRGTWQARLCNPDTVTDEGPLTSPILLEVQGQDLQSAVHHWHRQHTIHAIDTHGAIIQVPIFTAGGIEGRRVRSGRLTVKVSGPTNYAMIDANRGLPLLETSTASITTRT
ncbi:unnamed protein product, partial [Symbiodinium microadriaticum]